MGFPSKLKDIHIIFLLVLISFIVNHSWISFSVFAYSDFRFLFSDAMKDFSNFSSWFGVVNFGWPDPIFWRLPRFLVFSMFGSMGFDLNVADKFVIFWVWTVVSPIASYLFTRKITGSIWSGIIGSSIFTYNTYFLSINSQGHFPISIASAFGVLGLYFLISKNEKLDLRTIVFCAFSLFLSGIYEIRILYLFSLIIAFYFAYEVLSENRGRIEKFINLSKRLTIIYSILIALNLFWFLPVVASGALQNNIYLGRGLFGDQFWSLRHASLLFFPFWSGKEPTWFVVNSPPIYFYLFPILALAGLILSIRKRFVLFFGLLAILGIVLANQANPPFGALYVWLYENFPGFNAFREASKFYIFIAIGYSVLIGYFVSSVIGFKSKKRFINILKIILAFAIFGFSIVNAKPIITNEIGSMHQKRLLPEEYIKLNDFIVSQDEYFRIFFIPREPQWLSQITRNHPVVTFSFNNNWDPLFVDFSSNITLGSTMIDKTKADFFNNLLDQSTVKYVIIPSDDVSFQVYGENREQYIDEIDKLDFLKRTEMGFGEIAVYENENYRPHIYLINNSENYLNDQPYTKVKFEKVKTSEYKIHLKNIKDVIHLNFTDSYHPKWEVYVNNRTFLSSKNKLPPSFHKENTIGLNSYLIDPEYIRRNYPNEYYNINSDGGIDLKLVLYYQPDDYLLLGAILSLISASFVCFLVLVKYKI